MIQIISRRAVVAVLAGAGLVAAIAVCSSLLAQPSICGEHPEQRVAQIESLAVERPLGTLRALAYAAGNDPSPQVRAVAMAAMSHLPDVHRPTVRRGLDDADPRVRIVAAQTMAQFDDDAAVDDLVKLSVQDGDPQVRIDALKSLGRCRGPRAAVALLEAADTDAVADVKMAGLETLLAKTHGKISYGLTPANTARWREIVQRWKEMLKPVYAAAGLTPDLRPQDVVVNRPCTYHCGPPAAGGPHSHHEGSR
ncbi:MAG: HEAT repeat domain-containing protein [Planctomycetaceae bacterium]|nr:HEAT repeat domain-containing protein [Planctomycetaceae bacterium]